MNSIGIMAFVLLNIKMSLYIERFVFFFFINRREYNNTR